MNNIVDIFNQSKSVKEYFEIVNNSNYDLLINNTTENHNYLLAYSTFLNGNSTVVYVASNIYKATNTYESLCQLAGYENVCFYIVEEILSAELLAISKEFKFERIHTVNSILNNEKKIIVTSVNAITRELLPIDIIRSHVIKLKTNDIIDVEKTIRLLVESGYSRVPVTTEVGEFSVRGGIIDIFPINTDLPIRIDLFDNEIDFIKTYDVETQMTIGKIKDVTIYPLNEIIYSDPSNIINKIKTDCRDDISTIGNDLEELENYNNLEKNHKYIRYIHPKTEQFLDYIDDKVVFYDDIKRIEESYNKSIIELHSFIESKKYPKNLNLSFLTEFYSILHGVSKKVILSEFRQSLNNIHIDKMLDLDGYAIVDYQNNIRNLVQDIKVNKGKTYIITVSTYPTKQILEAVIKENELPYSDNEVLPKHVNVILSDNSISFGFFNEFEVINENNIYKKMRYKKTKYRSVYQNSTPITTQEDLKIGDYIVHYDYGICRYLGIKTVELQDIKNDYIMLQFENMELFIPVENINLLEKYQGSEGSVPKLTNLGTNEWEKKKKKVKEKLESIAKDLIAMQAAREGKKGFLYQADEELQEDFENDFEYIETTDQIKTINEIKKDMEDGVIIDRLVCGDVGYGKTEIAMRIAFKTVMNGKQVAYLAPTTILTRQHFYTFKERFEKYGIRIELMNRLITPKRIEEIEKDLADGKVDIVIGTHKLLNDKIKYKDLGLLIVDEEQRFGVTHKEKIKKFKANINVLTLTATPIPRTLQMSIMGVRQLSLIETPPQNRYPVQTYVLEENDIIIRETIYRELGRKGQVFYLHNRISDLDRIERKIKKLVPEARVLVAHGKMDKTLLEDSIQSFIDYEYDVLLCTTIIETGIDIPNTNTLIVDMADRLGLAQMYQIRGRVGRSNKVSYAYFMYQEDKVLTDTGSKRLNAIKEFTTLGSGYKIAIRDLAIRGAGDILGREQSGFIDSIGLDMYMKMLSEEIDKLKGIKPKENNKINYNIEVSQHVSDKYVSDDDIKIYIHKSISVIESKDQKEKLIAEMIDRFGVLTDEILQYIDKRYMDSLANIYGIESIQYKNNIVELVINQEKSNVIDGSDLFQKTLQIDRSISFEYKRKKIHIYIPKQSNNKKWIAKVITLLETFLY